MNKLTRERIEQYANDPRMCNVTEEIRELARMALAAMDSELEDLPLDYLQGHKDGLEWASQLAKANHPETGDWLYDDPIELAKAISKGPDMPPALPVSDSEPVAWTDEEELRDVNVAGIGYLFGIERDANKFADPRRQIMLYRHAQPAPLVDADDNFYSWFGREWHENYQHNQYTTAAKQMLGVMAESAWKAGRRAAMIQAGYAVRDLSTPVDPQVAEYEQNVMQPGNSPVIPAGWQLVPKEPTPVMISAWLSEVANFRGHVAGYKAALAAAPAPDAK